MEKKRYRALYVTPGVCDGFYDYKTEMYLDDEMIEGLLNKTDCNSIWEEKCIKLKTENRRLRDELFKKRMLLRKLKNAYDEVME